LDYQLFVCSKLENRQCLPQVNPAKC
jgi:hypothetical protein